MTTYTLSDKEALELRAQIAKTWAWSGYYYFPLHSTDRKDVLAFDGNLLESIFPESEFQRLLLSMPNQQISCWREIEPSEKMTVKEFEFGYGYSETIVVSEDLTWLIYWSHEDTVTFGGEQLISMLKIALPNWQAAVCTWGCNA